MSKIVWEDPPQRRDTRKKPPPNWASELRQNPGKWARVGSYDSLGGATSLVTRMNHGHGWADPKGTWEAASRTIDGRYYVYARYLGDAEEPGDAQ